MEGLGCLFVFVFVAIAAVLVLKGLDAISGRGPNQVADGMRKVQDDLDLIACPMCADLVSTTYTLGIAGESFNNDDGSSRQKIIKRCSQGDLLDLRREPDNPYDANAVAVFTATGKQVGYLSKDNAEWVAEVMDSGEAVSARVRSTARPAHGRPYGMVIDLTKG